MNLDELEPVDKRILELLKKDISTTEIANSLNDEGFRTSKRELFIRKSINNKILMMRGKGIDIPKAKGERGARVQKRKLVLVKPYIYSTSSGKFQVRKSVKGKMYNQIKSTLSEAETFLAKISKTENATIKKSDFSLMPKLTKIEMPIFPEEESSEFTVTTFSFKGQKAKEMAEKVLAKFI